MRVRAIDGFVLGAMMVLAMGCGVPGETMEADELPPLASSSISVKFKDTGTSHSLLEASAEVQGLFFGELEVVAYDLREGEEVQTHVDIGGYSGADWSYWVVLQSGHEAARDTLLEPSGEIDISAMNGPYANTPSVEFVEEVGAFELDFFEVMLHRTGVILDGAYYGSTTADGDPDTHPLHNYPEWSDIENHTSFTYYPGLNPGTSHFDPSALFARSDWFPEPVLVSFDPGNPSEIAFSSSPLTEEQAALLSKIVADGTTRRHYHHFIVIPYGAPLSIPFSINEDGEVATNTRVVVDFDLSKILDREQTDLSKPEIHYRADERNIPLGLNVRIITEIEL